MAGGTGDLPSDFEQIAHGGGFPTYVTPFVIAVVDSENDLVFAGL